MIATDKDVRAWAREWSKGEIPIPSRGRIPAWLWTAYLEQHPEASN